MRQAPRPHRTPSSRPPAKPSGATKYRDLADNLLTRIEAGEWKPGDQIPAETELASVYGASVGTVQKALQQLGDDGVLVRRHGSGTFVAIGNVRDEQVRHFRFLAEDEQSILPITIEAIDPVSRPFFAGRVSGVDITKPISAEEAAEIGKGMDQYGVLVFHGQPFTDDTQMAFSRNFGELELATTHTVRNNNAQRLGNYINDISNLDANSQVLGREDRRRLFSLGTRLWHSDSSFKHVPEIGRAHV